MICLGWCLLGLGACAAELPKRADIHYDVVWGWLTVQAEQHWRLEAGEYTLATELKLPLGLKSRRYVSRGHVGSHGLALADYQEFEGNDAEPGRTAHVDGATERLSYGRPGGLKTVKLPAGLQDLNALALQLTWLGAKAVGMTIPVTNAKGITEQKFEAMPSQTLLIQGTEVATERYLSHSAEGDIEIWLAPALGHLPVTVVRSQDGRSVRFVARQVSFTP